MDSLTLRKCIKLHERLSTSELAWPFLEPVDPVAMNLPTYFDVVRHPMDLHTMHTKLSNHQYQTPVEYREDFELMCANAIEFNKDDVYEGSVGEMAKRFLAHGLMDWQRQFSEDATTNWQEIVLNQFQEQMLERARDAHMIQRWRPNTFVARVNRGKREQKLIVTADTTVS